mmetsp:Transcript_26163/g.54607  ORF Transcript_26163/g.54607 Transcript_26163/m.54607 type:complete len:87 (+) Transcript_26163:73-333(+)
MSLVDDPNDCSVSNLAQAFKSDATHPYRTGVVGKWHLGKNDVGTFEYEELQDEVRSCGFDFAEALYPDNLNGHWTGTYTHNIDHNM